jgi:hypothetical protein
MTVIAQTQSSNIRTSCIADKHLSLEALFIAPKLTFERRLQVLTGRRASLPCFLHSSRPSVGSDIGLNAVRLRIGLTSVAI